MTKKIKTYKDQYQKDNFIMSTKKFLLIPESSKTPTDLCKLEPSLSRVDHPLYIEADRAGVKGRDYKQQVYGLTEGDQVIQT